MGYVRLQTEPFRVDDVLRELAAPATGGVTCYVGKVRGDDGGRRVASLDYEAFGEMAESQLESLRKETIHKFGLVDAIVIHRLGKMRPGDSILLVALAGAHRKETFAAVDHFMDRLKTVVPIWKKEETAAGAAWILGPENRRARG